MKNIHFLLSLILTLTLGIGQVWGALTNTYTKITSATSLDESAEYVIGNVDDYGCPTKNDGTTINNTEASWVRWSAQNVDGGFYLYNGNVYLKVPNSNAWGSGTSTDCSILTTNSEGILAGNDGSNNRILVKNSSNAYLRWYKSGQTKAYLYKIETSGNGNESGEGQGGESGGNEQNNTIETNPTYDFSQIEGLSDWGTSYSKRSVEYTEATVTFASANKSTQTITNVPVTKGGDVELILTSTCAASYDIQNASFVCTQWGSKAQTITLHYSTDGGESYTSTGTTSTNFSISKNNLPSGTNAVKITFNSTSNQVGIASATIKLKSKSDIQQPTACADPTFTPTAGTYTTAQSVTISSTTENAIIYYTIDGNDPTTSSSTVTGAIQISETTTVKAMAVKEGMDNSEIATADYTILPVEHEGTEADPYTVSDARNSIDANTGIEGVHATGIVSEIVTEYSSQFSNITFNFSADGLKTSSQLQAFRCGGTNAADVQVGDVVVVSGDLVKYNSTYEFAQGCQLISLEKPAVPTVSLKQSGSLVTTLNVEATSVANQSIDIVCTNFENAITSVTTGLYNDVDCAPEHAFAAGDAWVQDVIVDGEKTSVTFNVADNAGALRQCWLKITASDGTNTASAVLAISQAKYSVDYATLPFSFDGGRADIENKDGMTQNGLGTDYNSSPKLKFDGTGDWVIIKINEAPGTLTYDIKGNSFSGSTFTIQQSADGSNYSDVATYDALSDTQNEVKTLDKTTRFVKFIYTNKSNGNVALGNIAIAAYVESATLQSIAISGQPETTTYDAGNVFIVTGLVVTGTYDHGDPAAITEGITWEVRTNSASDAVALANYTLMQGQTALQVRATVSEIASNWYDVTGLTVNEHEVTPGKYDILLNNALWESELTGSLTGANLKDYSGSQNDISFAYNKGTGSNMYFNATQTRLYNGNELVVTAPTGYVIEKVEGLVATVQANAGTISENVWTGNVNSVTFSHKNSTGNSQLGTIYVTFAEYVPATVATPVISPAAGTFTSAQNVTITCETDGTTIYYTTDGNDPDNTSTPYTSAITVDESMTIKAIAYKDAEYSEVATAIYTINIVVVETPVSTTSKWVPATEVVNNMQVLIVGVNGDKAYAAGIQNTNNRAAVEGSLDGEGVFTPGDNTMAFTVVEQPDGTFALRASNDKYLYAASSGSNWLRSQDELDDNGKWTLTVSSAVANGTNTRNTMQFNSGSSCFACYGSASQKPIALYVEQSPEPPTPVYTEVRTELTVGYYYTMCLEKAVTAVQGGSIWRVLSKTDNSDHPGIILEEVIGTLDAGRPYFFYATAATLQVIYTGDAVGDPLTDDNNGLVGSFTQESIDNNPNLFILYNNQLYYVNSDNVKVGEHRAYLDMRQVPDYSSANPAPGRRRVTMHTNGTQVATGLDEVSASTTAVKMLMDGQLFILRDGKIYDATGRLVK